MCRIKHTIFHIRYCKEYVFAHANTLSVFLPSSPAPSAMLFHCKHRNQIIMMILIIHPYFTKDNTELTTQDTLPAKSDLFKPPHTAFIQTRSSIDLDFRYKWIRPSPQ